MITENLLEKIGFSVEMQKEYKKLRAVADERIFECATEYLDKKITMPEAKEKLDAMGVENMSIYTVYLLFVLECTEWLKEKYLQNGRTEEMFITAMRDILFKTVECEKRYGVFGIEAFTWYNGFFSMTRFATTRLQFDKSTWDEEPIKLSNYTVETGDLIFRCHIPSDGPLTYEKRLASYKELYDFYKDELKDGILVIHCGSWLLYPEYLKKVYSGTSNIVDFSKDFEMYEQLESETFADAWRVFYKDFEGDTSILPQETSLQKSFVKYLDSNPTFGYGKGVILFDGEKILTRK